MPRKEKSFDQRDCFHLMSNPRGAEDDLRGLSAG